MKNIQIEINEITDTNNHHCIYSGNRLINDKNVNYLVRTIANTLDSFKTDRPNLYISLKTKKEKEMVDDKTKAVKSVKL